MLINPKHRSRVSDWSGGVLVNQDEAALREGRTLPRLLVVDDEESICFALSEYFSLKGFRVDTAGDLGEAARLIDRSDYEVIIQDLRLGSTRKLDGLYIVKLALAMHPETKIIVLTAFGSPEIEDEAKRCGAAAFLRKPRPLSQVAQVVQVLIESPVSLAASPA